MADGTIKIDTLLDESGIKKGLSSLKSIASKGMKGVSIAVGAASTALTTMGGYALKVGSDFEEGMSKVESISGATADEMERLTEKAKEMGAKTKFSATESAAAMEYMAMAGWKTEDMLNGVEGIMNLAAASGEDLATTSDIVTDALTAFGLKASDAAHFSDVLAKASASSNTNVGMMGNTFKYVAPVAGALGYSIEDMALAIGLMANSGIKGEQAGTQLRAVLSRMTKPTDEVDRAMTDLGLSITRSDGSMKSFNEIMLDMRQGFSGLNEEQKATYAAMLGGQEAMSGLLAIVGASDEDFAALAKEINNADGAAQEMAETMQDNLKGQITILKSSLEGLGIEIYESVQEPLKEAAKEGINYVNQITDAFKSGGLQGAIKEAGKIFAELATSAAEQAPAMVDAAVSMIQAFIQGLSKNKTKIIKAAGQFVKTLASGIASLLPKEIQKPVKKMIDDISKSFSSGGLKKAVNTVVKLFKSLGTAISKIAKTVLPVLTKAVDLLGDKLDILIPMIAGVATGLKAWKIAQTVTKLIKDMQKATAASALTLDTFIAANGAAAVATATSTAGITAKTVATGVLTGQISLVTAAQWLWNAAMNANPIGIVITAVAALTAGIAALCLTQEKEISGAEKLAEANENLGNSLSGAVESMAEFQQEVSGAESYLSSFNKTLFASSEEQQRLEDNMQEVQDGITSICRVATKERRDYTAQEIKQLDEYFERLREMNDQQLQIEQSLAEVITQEAVQISETHKGSLAEYEVTAQEWIATSKEQYEVQNQLLQDQTMSELALLNQKYGDKAVMENDAYKAEYDALMQRKEEKLLLAQQEVADVTGAYADGYLKRSEDLTGFIETMNQLNDQEELENQNHKNNLQDIEDRYADKRNADGELSKYWQWSYDNDIEKENSRHQKEVANIHDLLAADMDETTQEQLGSWLAMVADADAHGAELDEETMETVDEIIENFDDLPDEMKESAKNSLEGFNKGMEDKEPDVYAKASSVATTVLSRLNKALGIASPSKKTRQTFRYLLQGAEEGLKKESPKLFRGIDDLSKDIMDRFNSLSDLDIHTMFQKAKAAVEREAMKLNASISASVNYQLSAASPSPSTVQTTNNQYFTFEQPMQAPDEIAREVRKAQTYGLAGAR